MIDRAWFKVPDDVGAITFGGVPLELYEGVFEVAESDVERVQKELPFVTRIGMPAWKMAKEPVEPAIDPELPLDAGAPAP